ncbi:MAG: cytochrome c [Acidobacteriota bacterium]|nr:cytochrome c [Pyrinomonadaceae bacterium]MDW8303287.1 cytochrome c [Acidobacteriota bacterium]
MKKTIKFILIIFAFALFFSCSKEEREITKSVDSTNTTNNAPTAVNSPSAKALEDELAEARKIFSEKCVKCHKEDGTGGKMEIDGMKVRVPNFHSEKMKKEPDSDFIKAIKNGIPDDGMPAFKDELTEEQIKQLVAFIRKEFQQK